ncbi:MAG TPA: ATP-binding protein [Thermotogota bacterium]|jgi:two-component system OmpR family sensor kinase|nr:ATP-binding protein [Thermotogota bacterium]HQC38029.1 ATP-binding protein [Thermotogota bacterium]
MSVQSETAIDRFLTIVSSFSRELNTARKTLDVYHAIVKVLRRFFDIHSFCVLEQNAQTDWSTIWSDSGFPLSFEELLPFVELAKERRSFSFYPLDEGHLLILPTLKAGRVVSVLMGYLLNDPEEFLRENESVLGFIMFFSGLVLENLRLYQEVLDSATVQEGLKKYFQTMLDSMDEAISVWDESQRLVFTNQSYIRSDPNEKVVGIIKNLVTQSYENRNRNSLEKEIEGHFYSFGTVLLGSPDQVLVSMEDISNTKELERIKKLDQIRTEFVSNISHEFRTPLAAIKAYAETIRDSFSSLDEETGQQFMITILEQSDHLEELLNRLLDFSKLENHTMQLEIENFDLVEQVQEVEQNIQKMLEMYAVSFSIETDLAKAVVSGDRKRINQVIFNFVTNAIKYRDAEKPERWAKVSIEESEEEGKVTLSVIDNGIGIPQECMDKVFEKFYRVDTSLTYTVEGTGLGLAVSKEILDKHHALIMVKSEEGKGSSFSFSLPKAE